MNTQLTANTTDPIADTTTSMRSGYRAPGFAPALTHAASLALREQARYLRGCMDATGDGDRSAITSTRDVQQLTVALQQTVRLLSAGLDALCQPVLRGQLAAATRHQPSTSSDASQLADALRAAADHLLLAARDLGAADIAAARLQHSGS